MPSEKNYRDMEQNPTFEKVLNFAVRIVNLCKYLQKEKQESIMTKQLLRSGTSIGANYSESLSAESVVDFIHKLSIAQKEANETKYWIILLYRTDYLSEQEYKSILDDCQSIRFILGSTIKTCKNKINDSNGPEA